MAEAIKGDGATDFGDGETPTPTTGALTSGTRPPVTPDFEWRSRAMSAEASLKQTREQLDALKAELDQHKTQAAAAQRRRDIEAEVQRARAIDNGIVTMLVEHELTSTPDADVAAIVARIKRDKPFLFSPAPGGSSAAGAPAGNTDPRLDALTRQADEARTTGDRRALLSYLRARRGN